MKPFPKNLHASALYAAQVYGDTELEDMLWQAENNRDMAINRHHQNLLHLSAINGYAAMARIMLLAGADIDAVDVYGNTPLSLAAVGGQEAVVDALLDYPYDTQSAGPRVNVEAADKSGYTPLMLAAWCGFLPVVRQLFDRGADIHATNSHCKTALSLATVMEHSDVVAVLKNHLERPAASAEHTVMTASSDAGLEAMYLADFLAP